MESKRKKVCKHSIQQELESCILAKSHKSYNAAH